MRVSSRRGADQRLHDARSLPSVARRSDQLSRACDSGTCQVAEPRRLVVVQRRAWSATARVASLPQSRDPPARHRPGLASRMTSVSTRPRAMSRDQPAAAKRDRGGRLDGLASARSSADAADAFVDPMARVHAPRRLRFARPTPVPRPRFAEIVRGRASTKRWRRSVEAASPCAAPQAVAPQWRQGHASA